jgi:ABC-type polar amino acid transport system ATPase subunit
MRDLNSDGQTIIMVTYDIQMAQNSADRIIKLRYGRVDNGKDSLEH